MTAKDFAGPVATAIAASTAAYVTVTIQRQNYWLARDRLKIDLFERRYEIYEATRDLIILISHNPDLTDDAVNGDLKRIYYKMTEAPFVCGPRAQAFCQKVRAADQAWRSAKALAATVDSIPPGREKIAAVLAPSLATGKFIEFQDQIVSAFSDDLWIGWPDIRHRR